MTARHAPPPVVHPRRWWAVAVADGALAVAVVVAFGHSVAPQVAAESVSLPERSPEPAGRGDLGGPLVLPSIGASGAYDPEATTEVPQPAPVVRSSRTAQRPQEARRTVQGSTATRQAPIDAPGAAEVPSSATSEQTVTEPTQTATTEAATTTAAETTETTTEATETTATTTAETTASETATATVSVTVTTPESTTEVDR